MITPVEVKTGSGHVLGELIQDLDGAWYFSPEHDSIRSTVLASVTLVDAKVEVLDWYIRELLDLHEGALRRIHALETFNGAEPKEIASSMADTDLCETVVDAMDAATIACVIRAVDASKILEVLKENRENNPLKEWAADAGYVKLEDAQMVADRALICAAARVAYTDSLTAQRELVSELHQRGIYNTLGMHLLPQHQYGAK